MKSHIDAVYLVAALEVIVGGAAFQSEQSQGDKKHPVGLFKLPCMQYPLVFQG